ncbi:gp16 family protein [Brevundimonas sp.]|uniref:gp16 family protein n=1 Tax=Brevundimonas sp. TaxID=1871086 RepID=UPI003F7305EC
MSKNRAAVVAVQIAKRDLGLDDDTYRDVLERVTGKRSSTSCTDAQLRAVLDEFKAKGWTPKVITGGKPVQGRNLRVHIRPAPADHPSAKKARALWISLWNLGEVRESSDAALEAFARRQLGCERLQWADQALSYKLIEALKAMAERAGWSQHISTVLYTGPQRLKMLKVGLLKAQAARLGLPAPGPEVRTWTDDRLHEEIREHGKAIRAVIEAAGDAG